MLLLTLYNCSVAVTRAKALLIVVGDPAVLGLDPLWRSFLNYVHKNDGWKGMDIPWDPDTPVREDVKYDAEIRDLAMTDMNAFTMRMEDMALSNVVEEDSDGDGDDDGGNVDRPWQDLE